MTPAKEAEPIDVDSKIQYFNILICCFILNVFPIFGKLIFEYVD